MMFPTIILPGFPTSILVDRYEIPQKTLWELRSFLRPKQEEMGALIPHPHDYLKFVDTSKRILPLTPFPSVYQKLFLTLKQNTRVYPFAYDWRMPLEQTEQRLNDFISAVLSDTQRVINGTQGSSTLKYDKVNLIGHSMGGLLMSGYIASISSAKKRGAGFANRINKAVTLGAPFSGSSEIVWRMAGGLREHQDTLRLVPAAYHLLPTASICGIDLFNAQNWSSQITKTIRQYQKKIQLREDLYQFFLRSGHNYRKKLQWLQKDKTPWLAVVGVGEKTRSRICLSEQNGERVFDFSASTKEGDGYVIKTSALPDFLKKEGLKSLQVSITDLEAGEFLARGLNALPNSWTSHLHLHTYLPGMNAVQNAIVKFLQED